MDQHDLHEWEARCIQEEPPACRAGCPLGVDGRGFSLAMAKGDLAAARTILEKSMPLAGLVARLCEAPCEQYCLRRPLGGALAIGALERLCIRTVPRKGKILRLPARSRPVRVIGSGPSSLVVAWELAKKGYPVGLYHHLSGLGAWLRHLPSDLITAPELAEELANLAVLGVEFFAVAVLDAALAEANGDAVYIGQDDELTDDLIALLTEPDRQTMALGKPGWFSGGLIPAEGANRFISAVSEGRQAATSIDRFLQGASLTASRLSLRHGQTGLFTNTESVVPQGRIQPAAALGYTLAEAMAEASRCLDCQCLECVRHCVYLEYFGGYPKSYARRVYNNSAIVKGIHQANILINSCSLCRQCQVLCPHDFAMADLCLDARQQMVREGRMPPSAHWFALEEMRSARLDGALLSHAPDREESRDIFFPGCQLAGIRPEQTARLYDHLRTGEPATGIWLDCCAAPAHWAGRVEEFSAILADLTEKWQRMGRPRIVAACSTCLMMFRDHLPELPVVSVWQVLDQKGLQPASPKGPLALTDPCTARHDPATQGSVRALLAAINQPLAALTMAGELTECCGFGGLLENANPRLARQLALARVGQSQADFLTYCAMCREQLAKTGKPVLHLLDLLFADLGQAATVPPVGISARRHNRRRLKGQLLANQPLAKVPPAAPWADLHLAIVPTVADLLEERRILEDDLRQLLYQAEQEGRWLEHGEDGRRLAQAKLGEVTFWLEYRPQGEAWLILNAWSHRMTIKGGRP